MRPKGSKNLAKRRDRKVVLRRLRDHPPPTPQPTPCRLWQGRTVAGYGSHAVDGEQQYIHRWVWEQVHGPIAPGIHILHKRDQPLCYRYDHLFYGTQRDNAKDIESQVFYAVALLSNASPADQTHARQKQAMYGSKGAMINLTKINKTTDRW